MLNKCKIELFKYQYKLSTNKNLYNSILIKIKLYTKRRIFELNIKKEIFIILLLTY